MFEISKKNKYYLIILGLTLFVILFFCGCFFFPYGSLYITSNPSGAQIFIDGVDTGETTPALIPDLYQGTHDILLTLDNPFLNKSESVIIEQGQIVSVNIDLLPETKYRALCVGIDVYKNPAIVNLQAPPFDVRRIHQIFENARFNNRQTGFSIINSLIGEQATRSNIVNAINSTFSLAGENDVSYFYFSGHGWSENGVSTILPHDARFSDDSLDISAGELADILGKIPGKKVVIIDSCYSGGFIGKGMITRGVINNEDLRVFNNNILNVFSSQNRDNFDFAKGNLAANGFQVIVSATGKQQCFETSNPHPVDRYPYGYFTASLCEGCGYNSFIYPYPADSNMDRKVDFNEIYHYISSKLSHLEQDVQIYPLNSTSSFVEY